VSRRKQGPAELLGALELLGERRAPYADLLAAIVADTFARFPPSPAGAVVEIGAGTGQLRAWLPEAVRARVVHTDPSGRALRLLRAGAPGAAMRVARAERLPWADGACAAVVGLDAFDAVTQALDGDPAPAVIELARVLAPGGRFVHFLDMATLLEGPFQKLAASGLVPIPNVFSDPGDAEWPLDIVLIGRDWIEPVLDLAARTAHPLAPVFGPHFELFFARPFDADRAATSFRAIASSSERRTALLAQLTSAARLSLQNGYPPLKPLPFHSGRYLLSLLETSFRAGGAFEVEADTIVVRSARRARMAGESETLRYRSLCVGHQRLLDELPRRLLTPVAAAGETPADELLVEAGMFVFVARKV
jgi:SAM-dependent methyltransferase